MSGRIHKQDYSSKKTQHDSGKQLPKPIQSKTKQVLLFIWGYRKDVHEDHFISLGSGSFKSTMCNTRNKRSDHTSWIIQRIWHLIHSKSKGGKIDCLVNHAGRTSATPLKLPRLLVHWYPLPPPHPGMAGGWILDPTPWPLEHQDQNRRKESNAKWRRKGMVGIKQWLYERQTKWTTFFGVGSIFGHKILQAIISQGVMKMMHTRDGVCRIAVSTFEISVLEMCTTPNAGLIDIPTTR